MIWDEKNETMSRNGIEELQLSRLRTVVEYCYQNSEFYKKRLDDAGVRGEHIKSLDDIEKIPFTTKEDFRDNYPYGLFSRPGRDIVRIHASSGTTGKPTIVGYTQNDLDLWADLIARLAAAAGAEADDTAQICFGYGLFTGALGLHYGLEKLGTAVVPSSSGNTEKQLMLMKDLETTLLVATPSYALYMSEIASELGYVKEDFKLRMAMLGSEGCTQEMREKIESAWGIEVTDNYGMSELIGPGVSGECVYKNGLHIAEDHFIAEIVDETTLRQKTRGEKGELVITTLTKEALPLLRYRTKDISQIDYSPCQCGRTLARMEKISGRTDDMLKIKGVNVFPSQIESVIVGIPQVSGHYQIVLETAGMTDTLEVRIEITDGGLLERYSELEGLQQSIHNKLRSVLGIDAKVTLIEPKSLDRFTGKAKRILDLRQK